jgi:hypothetical protein
MTERKPSWRTPMHSMCRCLFELHLRFALHPEIRTLASIDPAVFLRRLDALLGASRNGGDIARSIAKRSSFHLMHVRPKVNGPLSRHLERDARRARTCNFADLVLPIMRGTQ